MSMINKWSLSPSWIKMEQEDHRRDNKHSKKSRLWVPAFYHVTYTFWNKDRTACNFVYVGLVQARSERIAALFHQSTLSLFYSGHNVKLATEEEIKNTIEGTNELRWDLQHQIYLFNQDSYSK